MASGWDLDRGRALWWIFGAVLGATLLYIIYRFIGTLVFAVFLYYAARPIHKRLKRRVRPPSLAAAISILMLLGPALFLVGYVLAISFQELQRFIVEAQELVEEGGLERYEELIEPYVELTEVAGSPEDLVTGGGLDAATGLLVATVAYLGDIVIFGIHLFIIFGVAFYLLRDDYRLTRWFHTRFNDDTGAITSYLRAVDEDFHNIFFGNILNAAITGAIGAITFTLVNQVAPPELAIPYPALLGMLTGIASLIPVVGMKIVYVPVAVYLFVVPFVTGQPEAVWFPVVFTAVAFLIVDTIPDLVLRPYVSGRNLHMGSLMMAYVIGPLLFGWYGLFLLPMILVLVVHFARIVLPELVAGEPIRSTPVGPGYASGDEAGVEPPVAPTRERSGENTGAVESGGAGAGIDGRIGSAPTGIDQADPEAADSSPGTVRESGDSPESTEPDREDVGSAPGGETPAEGETPVEDETPAEDEPRVEGDSGESTADPGESEPGVRDGRSTDAGRSEESGDSGS